MEKIVDLFNNIPTFDLIYIIITILTIIRCTKRGFVLSILSLARWLLAYVITLFLFPKLKPYLKDTISNEYVLDVLLGVSLFVVIVFIILMINKGISKAVTYSGMGNLDRIFGFFFGFSILVLSNFIPTIYFGIFTGIAMLLAMISVLTLLPALLQVFRPFGGK